MTLSIDTVMLAIKAIQRDIESHETLASDQATDAAEVEYHGQYVLDLSKALTELCNSYEAARLAHPQCPSLDELLAPLSQRNNS
jgi:hypothetical protein